MFVHTLKRLAFSASVLFVLPALVGIARAQSSPAADLSAPGAQAATEVGADAAQSPSTRPSGVAWTAATSFGTGTQTSVAIHPSGLLVEVHASEGLFYTGLYYHIGKLNRASGKVAWGPSRRFAEYYDEGAWPAVAITPQGYVIITRSTKLSKSNSTLVYSVGTLNLNGGSDQTIDFRITSQLYDTGFHGSLSVNSNGIIAEAHEADGGTGIFYRLGHLEAPEVGDFMIHWDTGNGGVRYDAGIDPHISVNDNNDVVEVHGVKNESILHYTRGRIQGNSITFGSIHPDYDRNGRKPAVVLLKNSNLIEVHQHGNYPASRTGTLSPTQPTHVDWSASARISTKLGYAPAVACDGTVAVTTFDDNGTLNYAVSLIF